MAYLTQILRLPNSSFSRTLASKFYPTITNQDWFACSIFNCTIHSSTGSFRAFGSFAAKSEDGMVDHQEFQKWSNGGGLCHNLACIDPTAVVEIGAVIHERATLGANVHVGSGSVVGPCVRVGQSTSLGYNVALSNCLIGDSCVFHNGVCIGQDGFGFFVDGHGNMAKKPQVRLAANSCVTKDIKEPGDYGGFPAVPVQQWRRQIAALRLNSMKDIKNP